MGFQHLKKHPAKKFHMPEPVIEMVIKMGDTERIQKIKALAQTYRVTPRAIYNVIRRYKEKKGLLNYEHIKKNWNLSSLNTKNSESE